MIELSTPRSIRPIVHLLSGNNRARAAGGEDTEMMNPPEQNLNVKLKLIYASSSSHLPAGEGGRRRGLEWECT